MDGDYKVMVINMYVKTQIKHILLIKEKINIHIYSNKASISYNENKQI